MIWVFRVWYTSTSEYNNGQSELWRGRRLMFDTVSFLTLVLNKDVRHCYKCQTKSFNNVKWLCYRPRSSAKQGDNALGSIHPSVHLSVRLTVRLSDLSWLNRLTYDPDFQSEVFVCVSTHRVDAVDRLLIWHYCWTFPFYPFVPSQVESSVVENTRNYLI